MSTETAVRERPILFSGPMVNAILDGRKTQARRVCAVQPEHGITPCHWSGTGWAIAGPDDACTCKPVKCPYYGDSESSDKMRLWVRETWALVRADEDGIEDWTGPIPDEPPGLGWAVWYRAGHSWACDHPTDRGFRWHPSIFMPRWASRITLEITDVWVERLQSISEEDAIAEGATQRQPNQWSMDWSRVGKLSWYATGCTHEQPLAPLTEYDVHLPTARTAFGHLWDSILGKYPGCSWDDNPWVWCLSFRRIEGGAL